MTRRIITAYSSLRYLPEKASVSAVIAEYISAITLGIFSDADIATAGRTKGSNSYSTLPRSQGQPSAAKRNNRHWQQPLRRSMDAVVQWENPIYLQFWSCGRWSLIGPEQTFINGEVRAPIGSPRQANLGTGRSGYRYLLMIVTTSSLRASMSQSSRSNFLRPLRMDLRSVNSRRSRLKPLRSCPP